jgi:SAM-dependent methyltransferase
MSINQPLSISVEQMYSDSVMSDEAVEAALSRSLNPRSPDLLFERLAALGASPQHTVLDIGCRDGRHSCEIAKRIGSRVIGIDPVDQHMRDAQVLLAEKGVGLRVEVLKGTIGAIPVPDHSIDYIWCRDVLTHVEDLAGGFAECVRVLRPGGQMLTFTTFGTALLEPGDRARLCPPLAAVERNLSVDTIEAAATQAGLEIIERDWLGSEWREWREEAGDRRTSQQLLQCAHMLRDRERLISEIGHIRYEMELANALWGIYTMIGKLSPAVHVFRAPV